MTRIQQGWFRWSLVAVLATLLGELVVPNLVAQQKPIAPTPQPGGGAGPPGFPVVPGGGRPDQGRFPGGPGMPSAPTPQPGGGFGPPALPGGPGMPTAPTPQPGGGFGPPTLPGGPGLGQGGGNMFQRPRNPLNRDEEDAWMCESCGKECGRGKFPPSKCPHCGVTLINGIGRGDKPPATENGPNGPNMRQPGSPLIQPPQFNPGFTPPQSPNGGMNEGNINLPPVNPGLYPMGSSSDTSISSTTSSGMSNGSRAVLTVVGIVVAVLLVVVIGVVIAVVVASGKRKKPASRRRPRTASKPRRRYDDDDDDDDDRPRRRRRRDDD